MLLRGRMARPREPIGAGLRRDPALRDPALAEADLRDGFVAAPVPPGLSAAG
jgi:hypothetical protein